MKRYTLLISVTACLFATVIGAQVSKTGITVANFLSIDVGARAVGMGGAYVSVADDINSMYWNPAGIAKLERNTASFSNNRWIADVNFNFAGIAIPIEGFGVLGASATFLSMDDMQITTVTHPDGLPNGFFSAGSYALGISYGRMLTPQFAIGFNVKYLNEHISQSNANAIAFDVGTLFETPFNGLMIGMNISNFGTKMRMEGKDLLVQHDIDHTIEGNNEFINANLNTEKYDLPLMFRVGVSMDILKGSGNSNLRLSVDAMHPNNNYESVNAGFEYVYGRFLALRSGYNSIFLDEAEGGLSFGAGLNLSYGSTTLNFDYGYRDFGILNEIQMFTIGVLF